MAAWKWNTNPEDITEATHGTDWHYFKAEAEAAQRKLDEGFHIPACNLVPLQHKLAQLARRFKRVGKVSDIKLEVVSEYTTVPDKKKPWDVRTWYVCKVEGSTPKYEGWEFVAKIRHEAEGNYISCKPGEELAPSWRECKPYCEHCKTVRRRAETFVLRHEDGSLVQIGRNCIKDFLGGADPRDLADAAEWYSEVAGLAGEGEDEEAWGGGRSWPEAYPLQLYLENVAAIMRREDGYRKETTPGTAFANMKGERYTKWEGPVEVDEEDRLAAFTALTWLRWHTETTEQLADYFHNLSLLLKKGGEYGEVGGAFAYRQLRLAASIMQAFRNWKAKQVEQQAKAAAKPSEYFGTPGKRADFTLTLERMTHYETDYGIKYVLIFRDPEGNRAIWKTGSGYGLEPGDEIEARATVKEHSEYNGEKQTVLQRVDW